MKRSTRSVSRTQVKSFSRAKKLFNRFKNPPHQQNNIQSDNVEMSDEEIAARKRAERCAYNGGRSLNAVWYSDLPTLQKKILLFLGSEVNFNGQFDEPIRVGKKTLCLRLGYKKQDQIDSAIKSLLDRGYIEVHQEFKPSGAALENSYNLTQRFFDEYVDWLTEFTLSHGIKANALDYKRSSKTAIWETAKTQARWQPSSSPKKGEGGDSNNRRGGTPIIGEQYSSSSSPKNLNPTTTSAPMRNDDRIKKAENQAAELAETRKQLEQIRKAANNGVDPFALVYVESRELGDKLRASGLHPDDKQIDAAIGQVISGGKTLDWVRSILGELHVFLMIEKDPYANFGMRILNFCKRYREPVIPEKRVYSKPSNSYRRHAPGTLSDEEIKQRDDEMYALGFYYKFEDTQTYKDMIAEEERLKNEGRGSE